MFKNLIRLLLIKVIELNLFLRERLLFVAPKEQPPRKLSGKRTLNILTLERRPVLTEGVNLSGK
tara:strand:- start:350 stop:541 length:192 start_codon:yes stop_codon:yes gene_type:complete